VEWARGTAGEHGVALWKRGYLAQGPLPRAVGVGYDFLDGSRIAASIGAAQHDACSAAAHQLDGPQLVGQDEGVLRKRWLVSLLHIRKVLLPALLQHLNS
jgi:hypothetical protein